MKYCEQVIEILRPFIHMPHQLRLSSELRECQEIIALETTSIAICILRRSLDGRLRSGRGSKTFSGLKTKYVSTRVQAETTDIFRQCASRRFCTNKGLQPMKAWELPSYCSIYFVGSCQKLGHNWSDYWACTKVLWYYRSFRSSKYG
jgi:hypothetical protein